MGGKKRAARVNQRSAPASAPAEAIAPASSAADTLSEPPPSAAVTSNEPAASTASSTVASNEPAAFTASAVVAPKEPASVEGHIEIVVSAVGTPEAPETSLAPLKSITPEAATSYAAVTPGDIPTISPEDTTSDAAATPGLIPITTDRQSQVLPPIDAGLTTILLTFLYLLLFYRLILCGWGPRTDTTSITLSQACIAHTLCIVGNALHRDAAYRKKKKNTLVVLEVVLRTD